MEALFLEDSQKKGKRIKLKKKEMEKRKEKNNADTEQRTEWTKACDMTQWQKLTAQRQDNQNQSIELATEHNEHNDKQQEPR